VSNPYCESLGIDVPVLEKAVGLPVANTYALLLVALLERGAPMSLPEVAARFDRAGVAPAGRALESLQRCRPARPPVYRDGDLYALDPHDDELDLWAFRLGLRPPRVKAQKAALQPAVPPETRALPDPDQPLTVDEIATAWRNESLFGNWSAQRVTLAVLDAHRRPMAPPEVLGFLHGCGARHMVTASSGDHWRRGAPIQTDDEGQWVIAAGPQAEQALRSSRGAVRDLLERARQRQALRPDPVVIEAQRLEWERRREAHAEEIARLRRVVVHAFPREAPSVVALVDVEARELTTHPASELEAVRGKLAGFDVIAALEVRPLLRALGFDPGERRLAELSPPQKTMRLNRAGRTLKITTEMLIRGSCSISSPLGDAGRLREYLDRGELTKLRRRMEADAKSLFAYYQYGRLHGAVRLRWGFLDEMILAPWSPRDEHGLHDLKRRARDLGKALEIVVGSAPGWAEPWSRARICRVREDSSGWGLELVDAEGMPIDDRDVQFARVAEGPRFRIIT
jgi:hypothetical protein